MEGLARWSASAAVHIFGGWLGSARVTCECGSKGDEGLLGVIQRQLDRCGPLQLGPPPPVPTGFSVGSVLAIVLLCAAAALAGFVAGWRLHGLTAASLSPAAQELSQEPPVITPADGRIAARGSSARLL